MRKNSLIAFSLFQLLAFGQLAADAPPTYKALKRPGRGVVEALKEVHPEEIIAEVPLVPEVLTSQAPLSERAAVNAAVSEVIGEPSTELSPEPVRSVSAIAVEAPSTEQEPLLTSNVVDEPNDGASEPSVVATLQPESGPVLTSELNVVSEDKKAVDEIAAPEAREENSVTLNEDLSASGIVAASPLVKVEPTVMPADSNDVVLNGDLTAEIHNNEAAKSSEGDNDSKTLLNADMTIGN